MKNRKKGMKGFTILELLIVIGIISVIIIMGMSNYSAAQKRARDTRRKSDLKQIQKALELFLQDQNTPAYPLPPLALPGTCASSGAGCTGNIYMNSVPGDPNRQPAPQPYWYVRPTTLTYTLCACLENDADPDGLAGSCDISYACTSGIKYELIQP